MDNNGIIHEKDSLHKMILNLSAEVKAVRIENSRLKDEIMGLRASIAISKGNTDASEKVIAMIKENDMVCEQAAISHFNTLVNTFGNTLDETNDIGKQR